MNQTSVPEGHYPSHDPVKGSLQDRASQSPVQQGSQRHSNNSAHGFAYNAQTLPSISALTNSLPPTSDSPLLARTSQISQVSSDPRDSGNWSFSQSKPFLVLMHPPPSPPYDDDRDLKRLRLSGSSNLRYSDSSTVSNPAGLHLHTILNAESPTRVSVPGTPSSARVPSMHQQQGPLPALNQASEPPHASTEGGSFLESRRSSVDSRMNSGFTQLNLSPASPYESTNVSRASLASSMNQQRNSGVDHRQSAGSMSPLPPRTVLSPAARKNRVAPPIHPNPRQLSGAPDPMAAAPTKGFAWAFPGAEPEPSDNHSSSTIDGRPRTSSYTASVNSSLYDNERPLPAGQRRLSDGETSLQDQLDESRQLLLPKPSGYSVLSEITDVPYLHHHSLQHRSVTTLQNSENSATSVPGGSGSYSRTPELRVNHKMAERKRRSEMKSLFDELNVILPNSPGSKSSKWEILTKSIDYVKSLRQENTALKPHAEMSRRAQEENDLLRSEVNAMWQQLRRIDPNNHHVYGNMTHALAQQQPQPQGQAPATNGSVLPPLGHAHGQQQQWSGGGPTSQPQPSAMQGVEFAGGRAFEHR